LALSLLAGLERLPATFSACAFAGNCVARLFAYDSIVRLVGDFDALPKSVVSEDVRLGVQSIEPWRPYWTFTMKCGCAHLLGLQSNGPANEEERCFEWEGSHKLALMKPGAAPISPSSGPRIGRLAIRELKALLLRRRWRVFDAEERVVSDLETEALRGYPMEAGAEEEPQVFPEDLFAKEQAPPESQMRMRRNDVVRRFGDPGPPPPIRQKRKAHMVFDNALTRYFEWRKAPNTGHYALKSLGK
jgi:hypothetical protein